jgi:hypothetical protein
MINMNDHHVHYCNTAVHFSALYSHQCMQAPRHGVKAVKQGVQHLRGVIHLPHSEVLALQSIQSLSELGGVKVCPVGVQEQELSFRLQTQANSFRLTTSSTKLRGVEVGPADKLEQMVTHYNPNCSILSVGHACLCNSSGSPDISATKKLRSETQLFFDLGGHDYQSPPL